MTRYKGTFNFAANFEVLAKAPLDAKQLVGTRNDLITPSTWEDANGNVWLYNGAVVSVGNDPITTNRGIYFLCDVDNYTNVCSWIKQGSNGSSVDAENGLTHNEGIISLGGDLNHNTFIDGKGLYDLNILNVDELQISTSGTTAIIGLDNSGILLAYSGQSVSFDSDAGLTYGDDYSSGFTSLSLVTKKYVDDAIINLSNVVNVNNPTTITYYADNEDGFIGVSGGSTVYLPPAPDIGQKIIVSDIGGNAGISNIYVCSSAINILDSNESIINTNYGSITYIYNSHFWSVAAFTN